MKLSKANNFLIISFGIVALAVSAWLMWHLRANNFWRTTTSLRERPVVVGLSMGATREDRWRRDEQMLTSSIEAMGGTVMVEYANADSELQYQQAEKLVNSGVQVLIVVPHDAAKEARIVEMAHRAGVAVVAYDRLVRDSNLDYYVSFDNVKVGRLQAEGVTALVKRGTIAYVGGSPTDNNATLVRDGSMAVLQPMIDAGSISLGLDVLIPDWRTELAYEAVKAYLAKGGQLDGVVAANDGVALGVIRALEEKGLAGKVPVSGQDAELSACQRIVAGTQAMTVYKPISLLAQQTAKLVVALAQGQHPAAGVTANNGQVDVPAILLDPVAVTSANLGQTVIKDGFHTAEEVYANAK